MVARLYPDGAYGRYLLQNLDKDLNYYENILFASRSTTFMLLLSYTLYLQLRLIK